MGTLLSEIWFPVVCVTVFFVWLLMVLRRAFSHSHHATYVRSPSNEPVVILPPQRTKRPDIDIAHDDY